jgi:hypothetical protein
MTMVPAKAEASDANSTACTTRFPGSRSRNRASTTSESAVALPGETPRCLPRRGRSGWPGVVGVAEAVAGGPYVDAGPGLLECPAAHGQQHVVVAAGRGQVFDFGASAPGPSDGCGRCRNGGRASDTWGWNMSSGGLRGSDAGQRWDAAWWSHRPAPPRCRGRSPSPATPRPPADARFGGRCLKSPAPTPGSPPPARPDR